ncbi:MAG: WecB/TagA/CpsF family glycosyltransferase [Patescibacteria group bacterium]
MKKIKILDSIVNDFTEDSLKQELKASFNGQKGFLYAKVNTEFLLRARGDKDFAATLDQFDYSIADGIGVLWAAKFLSRPVVSNKILRTVQVNWQWLYTSLSLVFYPKYVRNPIPERIPGVDCLYLMLESAIETDSPVYILGAEEKVLVTAIDNLQEKYPKLRIVGHHEGYNFSDKAVMDEINRSGAKLLVVALGSPKQEYWIKDNIEKLPSVRVAVGEGGSFDFIAGTFKRAPRWMQKIGLEWLWRLFMNKNKTHSGGRARRIWNAVPVFMYAIVKSKINNEV